MKPNPQNQPDEEDNTFWQEVVGGVKKISRPETVPTKKVVLKEVTPKIHMNEVYSGNSLEKLEAGVLDNIDNNTAKRFKRGDFRIEGELDLHGFTEAKAYDAVFSFIKNAYLQNKRCVRIITGKGYHQESDDIFASKGILKDRVPQWLNSEELRPLILSFIHPDAKSGGTGALHILLRRQR